MNTNEIKILIEKYEAGKTSLKEERLLKQYFASGEANESLRHYIPLFAFYKNEGQVLASEGLEDKIMDKLDVQSTIPFHKNRTFWIWTTGIAASLIFAFSLIFELRQDQAANLQAQNTQNQADARQAYQQTKVVLAYISDKYTQGVKPLDNVQKLEHSSQTVNQLMKMGTGISAVNSEMKKMDKGVDQIKKLSKFSIVIKP